MSALPWPAVDPSGTSYILETHDIYVPEDASPAQDDVALLSFGDGSRALAFVESISATTNLQLYEQPYPRMSLSIDRITASEWDAHPAGEIVLALQRCYRDNAVPAEEVFGVFAAGWWSLATRRDAHAGRVGGAIDPFATVVHTADQPAETWETLLTRWTTIAGVGSCTHFAIGRSAAEGVVQLVPIDRNANHAGGDGHGAFVTESQSWHPNSVSVGIEIHCTGAIRQVDRAWRFYEDGAPHGLPIPEEDVIPDPARPGRGWHRVTDYQYEQLGALLDGLDATLRPLPANCVAQSIDPPAGIRRLRGWPGRGSRLAHRGATRRPVAADVRLDPGEVGARLGCHTTVDTDFGRA